MHLIIPVIHRIDHTFFQCLIRIIKPTFRLHPILRLHHILHYYHIFQVLHNPFNDSRYRTLECFFRKAVGVLHLSFREYHHRHLCIWEEFLRIITEHHSSYVLNHPSFCRTGQHIHPFKQIHCIQMLQFAYHATLHLLQIFPNQHIIYIVFLYIRITTPIKRHTTCHIP